MKSILYLTIVTITVLLQTCTIQATQLSKPSVTLRTNKDINNKDYYYKEQSVTNLSSYEIQKSCDNTQVIAQADAATTTVAPSKLAQTLKLTGLFVLWYAFNAGCKYQRFHYD